MIKLSTRDRPKRLRANQRWAIMLSTASLLGKGLQQVPLSALDEAWLLRSRIRAERLASLYCGELAVAEHIDLS